MCFARNRPLQAVFRTSPLAKHRRDLLDPRSDGDLDQIDDAHGRGAALKDEGLQHFGRQVRKA